MKYLFFFVSFFFIVTPVYADNNIFSILNETYIQNVDELKHIPSDLTPSQAWQQGDKIEAWIDIVGWEGMTKREGQYYILEGERPVIRYGIREGGNVESVDNTVTWREQDNLTIARLDSVVRWYTVQCDKNSCWRNYHTSNEAFEDSELTPLKIHAANQSIEVIVSERNYSIINSSDIEINVNDGIYDRYLIRTLNGSFEKINRIWHIETTDKGLNFANESKIDIFKSNNISHSQNIISVDNLNFSVTAKGFYFSTDKTNVTRIQNFSDPVSQFTNPGLLGFLSMLSAFYIFLVYTKRRGTVPFSSDN